MSTFGRTELLAYMRSHRLGVVSSLANDGAPQSALVGIATSDDFRVVFDTVAQSRKHANLTGDARASLVLPGLGEQTLQLEGMCSQIPTAGSDGEELRETYYKVWPEGRGRLAWAGLVYWCIEPRWARYSDFEREPLIVEFNW